MTTRQLPHVVFFFTDDQRFDTIAALGQAAIQTPNIDRLVRRGTAFTQAHIPSGTSGSIYFEYLSDGDFDCMTLELLDINDVPDKNSPTRKFIRGPDNVWHRDFPLNYMQWSRVEILFDSLVLDGESDGSTAIPLDITHLAKLQFKVRGKEGQSGQIIIDNVYFPDESTAICNRGAGKEMHESVFSTTSHGGFITGFWKNCVPRAGTVVEIIRMDGVVAKKVSMGSPGIQKVSVPIADLSPGGYVISVQGVSTTGEKINHRKCITLIK